IAKKCNGVKVKSMHCYFYLSKVQIRKNVLKYSNEVKLLPYIPPLSICNYGDLSKVASTNQKEGRFLSWPENDLAKPLSELRRIPPSPVCVCVCECVCVCVCVCPPFKKRAGKVIADPSHPGDNLFQLLPSGRRYITLYTKT